MKKRKLYYKIALSSDGERIEFHTGWTFEEVASMKSMNAAVMLDTLEHRLNAVRYEKSWMQQVKLYEMIQADIKTSQVIANEKLTNPDIAIRKEYEECDS